MKNVLDDKLSYLIYSIVEEIPLCLLKETSMEDINKSR